MNVLGSPRWLFVNKQDPTKEYVIVAPSEQAANEKFHFMYYRVGKLNLRGWIVKRVG
jgi:hypothetical protein